MWKRLPQVTFSPRSGAHRARFLWKASEGDAGLRAMIKSCWSSNRTARPGNPSRKKQSNGKAVERFPTRECTLRPRVLLKGTEPEGFDHMLRRLVNYTYCFLEPRKRNTADVEICEEEFAPTRSRCPECEVGGIVGYQIPVRRAGCLGLIIRPLQGGDSNLARYSQGVALG